MTLIDPQQRRGRISPRVANDRREKEGTLIPVDEVSHVEMHRLGEKRNSDFNSNFISKSLGVENVLWKFRYDRTRIFRQSIRHVRRFGTFPRERITRDWLVSSHERAYSLTRQLSHGHRNHRGYIRRMSALVPLASQHVSDCWIIDFDVEQRILHDTSIVISVSSHCRTSLKFQIP